MKPTVNLKKSSNAPQQQVHEALSRIARSQVYVGIPEGSARKDGDQISNAELMYVFSKGSPARGIPARPVLEPAIEASDNKGRIADSLAGAARHYFDGQPAEARAELEQAGQIAENASKRWFTDPRNNWAPNAPSTVKRKGSSRPGMDSGQLRGGITYVVDEK